MNMAPYQFCGTVECVGETQTFPSGFRKRSVVVTYDPSEKYPTRAAVDFSGERTALLDAVKKGDHVRVQFYPDARFWEPKGGGAGRWMSSLRGQSIDAMPPPAPGMNIVAPSTPASAPAPAEAEAPAEDLPF